MSVAILRTSKLKTLGNVAGSGSHVMRNRVTPNADPKIENINLVGSGDLLQDVKNILPEKIRKNAVLCVENLLTASPDFFKNKSVTEIKKWADDSVDSMKNFWGAENVVAAILHLDESTPHIHLYAVPKIGEKLNCREFLGGRAKLSKMQDHYANDMQRFGLDRGLKGSKAKHLTMKQISSSLAQAKPKLEPVFHKVIKNHEQKIVGHDLVETKEIKVVSNKSAKNAVLLAQSVPLLRNKNKELERQLSQKIVRESKLEREAKLSLLREQNLIEVAEKFGFIQDKKDKKVYRRNYDDMKISINNSKFFDFKNNQGGGGAIDFVMHVQKTDFKNAVSLLSHEISPDFAALSVAKNAVKKEINTIKSEYKLSPPDRAFHLSEKAKSWLHEVRKIPKKIINDWYAQGLFYANKFGSDEWQIIWKQSENAYLRENPLKKFKGWVLGSTPETLLVSDSARVAVVESHVDAMSLQAMDHEIGICVAAGLSNVPKAVEMLKALGKEVVIAVDNDTAGDDMARQFQNLQRITPKAKDWNDDLRELHDRTNTNTNTNTNTGPSF